MKRGRGKEKEKKKHMKDAETTSLYLCRWAARKDPVFAWARRTQACKSQAQDQNQDHNKDNADVVRPGDPVGRAHQTTHKPERAMWGPRNKGSFMDCMQTSCVVLWWRAVKETCKNVRVALRADHFSFLLSLSAATISVRACVRACCCPDPFQSHSISFRHTRTLSFGVCLARC